MAAASRHIDYFLMTRLLGLELPEHCSPEVYKLMVGNAPSVFNWAPTLIAALVSLSRLAD